MESGKKIIEKFRNRWQWLLVVEVMLYALGVAILSWSLTRHAVLSGAAFVFAGFLSYVLIKPWRLSMERVSNHIDHHLQTAEYSSSLLLAPPAQLSGLAALQQQKVGERLARDIHQVKPKTGIKRAGIITFLLGVLGFILFNMSPMNSGETNIQELVTFQAADSITSAYLPPSIQSQKLTINYPTYTGKPNVTTTELNVKAVEGTQLSWRVAFNGPVDAMVIEGFTGDSDMKASVAPLGNGEVAAFTKSYVLSTSGYYNFRFTDTTSASYVSDLYALEVIKDKAPVIEIKNLAQFTSFDFDDTKELSFQTEITDDYGIGSAQIVATVSKGSGESVKFREEKLPFDREIVGGTTSVKLAKSINLDQLNMEPGDELYFYVEALDLKEPKANIARSETYFAVLKDTITDNFSVVGTMGVDLMPDYFRSQRQLIIDTEKLITEKSKLTRKEFKAQSNDLGFDQKALRLKYGQFMGDEDDSGIAVDVSSPETNNFNEDDPTDGFRHDHDHENEHNIVDHDHDHEETETTNEEESPLEAYLHNHDDPEESTLFTASLRSKLQQAMAQMWDAELYLRLGEPQTSLPYQYKALKLIQEIKNSARIYVHRIGFDPPPIKEDKRLTGDLEEIDSYFKEEERATEDPCAAMKASIRIIEERILGDAFLSADDKAFFTLAGEELAAIAIDNPGKHLNTLQQLKRLTEEKIQPKRVWRSVQRGLLQALPQREADVAVTRKYQNTLGKLLIKELQTRD